MSKSENAASERVSDEQQSGSVYDFLYYDERRIGSFLSQFDTLGVPTRVSVSESIQKARGRAFKFGASGGVNGVGNASVNVERGPAVTAGAQSEQRDYDPFWANGLALLDYLETNNFLCRDLPSARIGQFVVISGALMIMDLTLFKGIWSLPAVRNAVLKSAVADGVPEPAPPDHRSRRERRDERRGTATPQNSELENVIDGALALVGMLPHTVQARLAVDDIGTAVWTSLREEGLIVSGSDLTLKHGAAIAGKWSTLGILDAFPDVDAEGNLTQSGIDSALSIAALGDSPFELLMSQVIPHFRPMLGRPHKAHGITPLIIFREIEI